MSGETFPREPFAWLSGYLASLRDQHVLVHDQTAQPLAPARVLEIDAEDWGKAASVAATAGLRWAACWGDHIGDELVLRAVLEAAGDYIVLRTVVPLGKPVLPSHTPHFAAANHMERHTQDLLGVAFLDHPDSRRWIRHRAWPDTDHPLRRSFSGRGKTQASTPADANYRFEKIQGSGVVEIAVGPVHAGIIEPGHFRFQAVGEQILRLETRLGYTHKGIEKIAVGRDPDALARLAARVSGDCTVGHTWAACQALERASACQVPERALILRALMAERERVANHLGDIGAIGSDVGFAFAHCQLSRLREYWQRRNDELFGHRLLMDRVIPGGVAVDLDAAAVRLLHTDHVTLRRELAVLFDILDDHPSLDDRLLTTGYLAPDHARNLGVVGFVGRASGQGFDLRRDQPYAPYDRFEIPVPLYSDGDVAARMRVRMDEVYIALNLMDQMLDALPGGVTRNVLLPAADAEGLGCVESWRGEIISYVRLGPDRRVARFFPRDPSWLIWPTMEQLIAGNIVPDFPVCNKSINASYSGHDL